MVQDNKILYDTVYTAKYISILTSFIHPAAPRGATKLFSPRRKDAGPDLYYPTPPYPDPAMLWYRSVWLPTNRPIPTCPGRLLFKDTGWYVPVHNSMS
jgi:hypothetical protein